MEDVTKQASGTPLFSSMAPGKDTEPMAEGDLKQRTFQQLPEYGQSQENERQEEGNTGLVTSSQKITIV